MPVLIRNDPITFTEIGTLSPVSVLQVSPDNSNRVFKSFLAVATYIGTVLLRVD